MNEQLASRRKPAAGELSRLFGLVVEETNSHCEHLVELFSSEVKRFKIRLHELRYTRIYEWLVSLGGCIDHFLRPIYR